MKPALLALDDKLRAVRSRSPGPGKVQARPPHLLLHYSTGTIGSGLRISAAERPILGVGGPSGGLDIDMPSSLEQSAEWYRTGGGSGRRSNYPLLTAEERAGTAEVRRQRRAGEANRSAG